MLEKKTPSYFKRLLKGQINLNITFWVWFVFVTLAINIFIDNSFIQTDYHQNNNGVLFSFIIYLLSFIYSILIFIAVYKSAQNYIGNKLWPFLARVIISINLFFSLFSAYDLIKVTIFEDYAIKSEINSFKNNLPLKVNEFSHLIDININKKNIYYTYRLDNMDISSAQNYNLKRFKSQVQDSLCEEENTVRLLKKDYILNYTYIDKNAEKLIDIETKKTNCGKGIYDLDILKELIRQGN
ncbi:hypothetical protein KO488_10060 [Poseidonibacter lekithochrous]|uniref:hypothetical protein n=1 Tax=Poseidonibacter TaxID=2321187 RepID=UPI001C09919F|nr:MULTISPECIES: hypothetical protein [Poseidonibacter]MBU3015101.1 hypothetical protein [Poseidonibacter lekithochrous]MDO6828397.1 hypothetical protein [Poseidonibacter sp. 1_MG-2023]